MDWIQFHIDLRLCTRLGQLRVDGSIPIWWHDQQNRFAMATGCTMVRRTARPTRFVAAIIFEKTIFKNLT